jgi:glyoxylase-like metal-dependent hydrolase (beta-lactamase superfamily II)
MEHFRLEQVADDAWAAVALSDTGGNAGFIRVADFTIVFDTFASTAAADELRISAEVIAPVAYAINSHWHAGHVSGNRSFDDVAILATERTRELMEDHAAAESDLVFPTDTFEERLEREGAVVETLGGGHTESDAFLWFEGTVFTGDLVVVERDPSVGDGDVEHWLEILDAFEARRPRVIVPGHGPIGSVDDIPPLRRYLEGL